MRSPKCIIVDVMSLLHIGDHRFANYGVGDGLGGSSYKVVNHTPVDGGHSQEVVPTFNQREYKTGGMYALLNLFRKATNNPTQDIWIFAFDSKSFRKEIALQLGFTYKEGRVPKYHLYSQSDELYRWLNAIGYNAIKIEGLEADDIIASVVHATKQYNVQTEIITTDRDLASLVSDKVSLISPNPNVANVTMLNYKNAINSKHVIPYNTVNLYKVICGDSSDKIPAISNKAHYLYKKIIDELFESGYELSQLGDFNEVKRIVSERVPQEFMQKAKNNIQMFEPFIVEPSQLQIKPLNLNVEALTEFCAIFAMKSIAKKFGITYDSTQYNVNKYRSNLIDEIHKKYGDNSYNESSDGDEEIGYSEETLEDFERIDKALENRGHVISENPLE